MAHQSADGAERRRLARRRLVKFVWYRVIDDEEADPIEGIAHSCDLSRGGVGLKTPRPLPHGAHVFLELSTGKVNLSAVGKVVYTRQGARGNHHVGIQLMAVPPNDRVWLNRFCDDDAIPNGPPESDDER